MGNNSASNSTALTVFKAGFGVAVAFLGINAWGGITAAKGSNEYVTKEVYQIEKLEAEKKYKTLSANMDEVLALVQKTDKEISIIKALRQAANDRAWRHVGTPK